MIPVRGWVRYGDGSISGKTLLPIYIEGDGDAWKRRWQPSADPTPKKAQAFQLAAADHSSRVVYLGRPCQYLSEVELKDCNPSWWTGQRFSPKIIETYEQLIDQVKGAAGATQIRLIGYSGGGVLATLLAQQRSDVEQLMTVAAPLALSMWSEWHRVSPLMGSLDPLQRGGNHEVISSAMHWAGAEDRIVPPAIINRFVYRQGGVVKQIEGFDHQCCWTEIWPQSLKEMGQGGGK